MADPRFQVFVSSTYVDLVEERRQVTEQLLKLRCIPAGMELFTAGGQPPWEVIQAALGDTDYMVLILAGRYGSSVGSDGRSYTEREYDYAVDHNIPVLAFLHEEVQGLPARHVDQGVAAEKRETFWARVRDSERHTVAFWREAHDLASKVAVAVPNVIRTQPRIGWVRRDSKTAKEADSLNLRLTRRPSLQTSDDVREALVAPGGVAAIERAMSGAVRDLRSLPFPSGQGDFNSIDVAGEYAKRLAALEEAVARLVQIVTASARWGSGDVDRYWVDLIMEFSTRPRLSGSTVLIDLVRAPAALVLRAAGLGACVGGREDVVGYLISPQLLVDHPYKDEDAPAVAVLFSSLMYATGWPDKRLLEYFQRVLGEDDAWDSATLERGWERWQYFISVARTYYSTRLQTGFGPYPYLRIESGPGRDRVVIGKTVRRQVQNAGDSHPVLQGGACDHKAELFEEAAETFDGTYAEWGKQEDWKALPGNAGILPSAPHYPGSRDGL